MTITLTREEAQQVLEALEAEHSAIYGTSQTVKATELLRTRLAQSEPEPVAWMFPDDLEQFETSETFAEAYSIARLSVTKGETVPLYTAPPHREWQSLTHEEKMEILTRSITAPSRIDVAEAMLKEKNNG